MKKRKPSMRDVAELANVSVSAVSLVVRNKAGVADETRERVWEAIAQLGYAVAEPQDDGRAPAVGLLIERGSMPAILDIFYGEVVRGLQTEAQRLGYQVVLHMFDRHEERFDRMYEALANEVQGFVIANDGDITPAMVEQAQSAQLPLVLIESYLPGQRLPCVIGDNFTAGYTVTRHLLAQGHREIALLRGLEKYSSLVDRGRGYFAAMAEAQTPILPEWLPPPVGGLFQRGYLQMRELLQLEQRPTAVVAISDKTAFGALEGIREAGLRIPDDMAIVSIDDVAESAHTRPPLTSYHIPRADMGVLAMQKLNRLISGEPELAVKSLVYGELVVRESCGAAHQPANMRASTLVG